MNGWHGFAPTQLSQDGPRATGQAHRDVAQTPSDKGATHTERNTRYIRRLRRLGGEAERAASQGAKSYRSPPCGSHITLSLGPGWGPYSPALSREVRYEVGPEAQGR